MSDRIPHIINDGYSRWAYISPLPRVHEAQRFRFRPVLPATRQQYLLELDKAKDRLDGPKIILIGHEIILGHVTDLSAHDETGKETIILKDGEQKAPSEILLQMEPNVLVRIQNICMGLSIPDEEPVEDKQDAEGGPIVDPGELARLILEGSGKPSTPLEKASAEQETDSGN